MQTVKTDWAIQSIYRSLLQSCTDKLCG